MDRRRAGQQRRNDPALVCATEFGSEERETAKRLGVDTYDVADAGRRARWRGADGLLFHPYLAGERAPFVERRCACLNTAVPFGWSGMAGTARRLMVLLPLAGSLAGCGMVDAVFDGFKHAKAVETDLTQADRGQAERSDSTGAMGGSHR